MPDHSEVEFRAGRFGRTDGDAGVVIQELQDFSLASVLVRRGCAAAASGAAERAFGVPLPSGPQAVHGRDLAFIGTGPGQWLALCAAAPEGIESRLQAALGDTASAFDQSDSRVLLEIGGPRVRDALAKGIGVDLHPRAFRTGDCALTTASHIGVQLWQAGEAPTYRLLTVRTYFGSFWHWLASSSAEYGARVLDPARYPHAGPNP